MFPCSITSGTVFSTSPEVGEWVAAPPPAIPWPIGCRRSYSVSLFGAFSRAILCAASSYSSSIVNGFFEISEVFAEELFEELLEYVPPNMYPFLYIGSFSDAILIQDGTSGIIRFPVADISELSFFFAFPGFFSICPPPAASFFLPSLLLLASSESFLPFFELTIPFTLLVLRPTSHHPWEYTKLEQQNVSKI